MTKEHFCELGDALYGNGWQSKMARDLNLANSTVNRWARGHWPVPIVVQKWLRCAIKEKWTRVRDESKRLKSTQD